MNTLNKNRIESIDLLKGLVMVIMALDHVRDFYHSAAYYFDPTDLAHTTVPIFFTRWITHFCAPVFSFLAGASAFFVGRKKSVSEVSAFLWKRGLWLVFLELTVVTFGWTFDIKFGVFLFLVIWALGMSMIVLAALVHLPRTAILIFSCVLIFGHNMLDTVHFDGNFWWAMLHEQQTFQLLKTHAFFTGYSLIPWIGVMSLGYYFGGLYDSSVDVVKRKRILNTVGLSAILLFITMRWINRYGNPIGWGHFDSAILNFMSFLNVYKYPPSLLYLMVTLGPACVFLANSEKLKGKIVNFFCVIGRVPFFYYFLHLYLIHTSALLVYWLYPIITGKMVALGWIANSRRLTELGFGLPTVYIVWILIIAIVYPLCKKYDVYKKNNREKWWLSYL